MTDESEEKTLPASEKKLRDARRKGQVPHSKDLVSGTVFIAAAGYLLATWTRLADELQQLIDVVAADPTRSFDDTWNASKDLVGRIVVGHAVALGAVMLTATFLSGMAATFGPVFSFEAFQPKLDHIDPMKGIKRIVSLRSLIELGKSLVKIAVVAAISWCILRDAIGPLIETPSCGLGCFGPIMLATIKMLASSAAAVVVIAGLADLLIQRQLFLKEMRMSHTESKREYKNMEGDPHVRGEQRRLRREFAGPNTRLGLRNAVIAVNHGNHIVGLRYVQGENAAPVVVCKGRGEVAERMRAEVRRLAIPLVDDAVLATALFAHVVGHPIRRELYDSVARALFTAGVGKPE
jgi:type III secretion protein U